MTKHPIPNNLLYFYSDAECPFMSISDCPEAQRDALLDGKNERNAFFASRFSRENRRKYLEHRRLIEERLLADFIAKGGEPRRQHPYYAYLSRDTHAESLPRLAGTPFADAMCIEMGLTEFLSGTISFTYEDSCISYGLAFHPEGLSEWAQRLPVKPCHGVLYRLEELGAAIEEHGFPANCYEAQIWDDAPLEKYRQEIERRRQQPDRTRLQ